ncbi:MAG: molybdopterin dinucleotide binding domain-containing protein [Planctomycetota bacterium]
MFQEDTAGAATEVINGGAAQTGYLFNGGDTPGTGAPVTVNAIDCDTVLQLVYDRANSRTLAQWAGICNVPATTISSIAAAYAANMPDANLGNQGCAVNFYRGACQHTHGLRISLTLHYLNMLMGNADRKGGLAKGGGHWHEDGTQVGQFPIGDNGNTNDVGAAPASPDGPRISRAGYSDVNSDYTDVKFTNARALDGFPPPRPWFPLAKNGNWQEVIPSMNDGYPYNCSVLFTYAADPLFTTPASRAVSEQVFASGAPNYDKIKLFVSIDVEINETNVWADYILPDTTYLEKWSTPHVSPAVLTKVSGMRQPVVGRVWDGTTYQHISNYFTSNANIRTLVDDLTNASSSGNNYAWSGNPYYVPYLPDTRIVEDIYGELAMRLGAALGIAGGWMPAFGPNGFTAGASPDYNAAPYTRLITAWDWYYRLFANFGIEGGSVSAGTNEDDIAYLLARGGRFADGDGYDTTDPNYLGSKIDKLYTFYSDRLASTYNTLTGLPIQDGLGNYLNNFQDWRGTAFDYSANYPLLSNTYKPAWHTQSRTVVCPTLMGLWPENFVEMNTADAAARGIVTGDTVRLASTSNPTGVVGKALVSDNMAQGVVGVSASFGHWEMHSRAPMLDGGPDGFDPTRAAGVNINPVLELDPNLGDVALQDILGGSCSFYDTRLEVTKL